MHARLDDASLQLHILHNYVSHCDSRGSSNHGQLTNNMPSLSELASGPGQMLLGRLLACRALLSTCSIDILNPTVRVTADSLREGAGKHCLLGVGGLRRSFAEAAPSQPAERPPVSPPVPTPEQIPLHTGRKRVVVLGSGWAAARLVHDLNCKDYDLTVVSPRNHMVFTPLLASACVGTIEPRSTALPLTEIQRALREPHNYYFCSKATHIDTTERKVDCIDETGIRFSCNYDALAIATGSQGSTFGIPGVTDHAHFLREVQHTSAIRSTLISNWNQANIPGRSRQERLRLLHTVVVGGGPTGVEFAAELTDFINKDLRKIDYSRARDMRVTLVEANEVLGTFDVRLREYAAKKLHKQGVHLIQGVVKSLREADLTLSNGDTLGYGLCVWSTGVGPTDFTTSLPFAKSAKGRIAVDDELRVLVHPDKHSHGPLTPADVKMTADEHSVGAGKAAERLESLSDVYALGDCSANIGVPLPALAQVAEQQGKYLAKKLNKLAGSPRIDPEAAPFRYHHMGSMATVGGSSAVIDTSAPGRKSFSMAGFTSWLAWRSAYLTKLGSMRNRLYLMLNWATTMLFGRDISRW